MATSLTNLSREQIENLLILGGWAHITGTGWHGLKRPGMNGVVYARANGIGSAFWAARYAHEPDDKANRNLSWRPIGEIDLLVLLKFVKILISQEIL